jgi:eukaryotic-like serine/threonine-protein kinase
MARVWTSGKVGSLTMNGPLSQLLPSHLLPAHKLRSKWLSGSSPAFEPLPGTLLTPRLRLVRPVTDGRGSQAPAAAGGGNAGIWVAEHLALAMLVEVELAPFDATASPEAIAHALSAQAQRFAQRVEVTLGISEPHLVQILEQGDVKGVPFIVTELLEGRGMRHRLLHGPASLAEVETLVMQGCAALAKAHSLGVAHGNLSPDVLFSTEVADSAFAKVAGFGSGEPGAQAYSSPEQLLLGTANDARSDMWAFAVSLYELLTTTLPFEAATPAGVTVAICNAQFSLPSHYRADLPPGVDAWFARALAREPSERFADAEELAREFARALSADAPGVHTAAAPSRAPESHPAESASQAEERYAQESYAEEGYAEESYADEAPIDGANAGTDYAGSDYAGSDYAGGANADAPYGEDASLELDDGEEDEKTVRWDLPDNWSGSLERAKRAQGAASNPGGARPSATPPRGSAAVTAGTLPRAQLPPSPSQPALPAPLSQAVLARTALSPEQLSSVALPSSAQRPSSPRASLLSASAPPSLEPSMYLDSPYIASVASALAVPTGPNAYDALPPSARGSVLAASGLASRRLPALSKLQLSWPRWPLGMPKLSPEKTWLAAAAFAAGVAVTWFTHDPEPRADGSEVSVLQPEQEGSTPIRTLSVDDLQPVPGEEGSSLAILRTNQLPSLADEASERPAPSATPVVERRAAVTVPAVQPAQPVQKVHALTPAPAKPAARAPDARSSNCSPPYFFDAHGIQRLKSECMDSSRVIAGPYGAVIATNVATKGAALAAPAAKSASSKPSGNATCNPPYYFDGNIRRIKTECL